MSRRRGQAEGGARAWNRKCGADANTNSADAGNRIEPALVRSGKAGATGGAEVATSWIKAQIGQSRSSEPSGSWPDGPSSVPDPVIADWVEAGVTPWGWT